MKAKVVVSKSSDIQQRILDNRLDFALIEENINNEYLEKEYLCTDYMSVIFPKDHPLLGKKRIYMKDIVDYPMLLREEGSANRTYLEHVFAMHDIAIDPIWESANPQALINAVEKDWEFPFCRKNWCSVIWWKEELNLENYRMKN